MTAPAAIDTITAPGDATLVLHPLRRRILDALREPASATELARRFELPRQKVNYHMRELEGAGFVEVVEERRRGNCTERIVRATARAYLISPAALGALAADPEAVQDQFSASYLLALAGQAVRDLGALAPAATRAGRRLATLALQSEIRFASAADRSAFTEELSNALALLIARYHDETTPGGRRFRLIVGAYPTPVVHETRDAPEGEA